MTYTTVMIISGIVALLIKGTAAWIEHCNNNKPRLAREDDFEFNTITVRGHWRGKTFVESYRRVKS
jgi:hypothetical protein